MPDAAPEPDDSGQVRGAVGDAGVGEDGPKTSDAPAPASEPAAHPLPSGRDIVRALLRPSKGQFAVGVLCLILGFGAVVQVRAQQGTQAWAGARRDDLVSMVDSLDKEHQRLAAEQEQLERTKSQLQSGNDSHQVAADEAARRLDTLGILAGTSPATGPGIQLVISDPQGKVTPAMVLDCIEELRDAGAEAIELNDHIRVVANTAFTQGPNGILAGGEPLAFPLRIDAIGDAATLESGARFRGGIVSQVQAPTVGGAALITQVPRIDITSVVPAPTFSKAKPAR